MHFKYWSKYNNNGFMPLINWIKTLLVFYAWKLLKQLKPSVLPLNYYFEVNNGANDFSINWLLRF
jgi:hypothetical protein